MLGNKFFAELQGGRASGKTKVYDANVAEMTGHDHAPGSDDQPAERAFVTVMEDQEPELNAEFMDVMHAAYRSLIWV